MHFKQRSTCNNKHKTHITQHTLHNTQHTTHNIKRTTQHTTYNNQNIKQQRTNTIMNRVPSFLLKKITGRTIVNKSARVLSIGISTDHGRNYKYNEKSHSTTMIASCSYAALALSLNSGLQITKCSSGDGDDDSFLDKSMVVLNSGNEIQSHHHHPDLSNASTNSILEDDQSNNITNILNKSQSLANITTPQQANDSHDFLNNSQVIGNMNIPDQSRNVHDSLNISDNFESVHQPDLSASSKEECSHQSQSNNSSMNEQEPFQTNNISQILGRSLELHDQNGDYIPIEDTAGHNNFIYNFTSTCLATMKSMSNEQRRPLMSIATQVIPRRDMGELLGQSITKAEWAKASLHVKYPGLGHAVLPKPKYRRKCFEDNVVKEFIEWLHSNNFLQSLSFGQKVVKFYNGVHTAVEAVKMTSNQSRVIEKYAESYMKDVSSFSSEPAIENGLLLEESDLVDLERCKKHCKKSKVQCYREEDHDGNHIFTPKGSLSASSIARLLKQITSGQIKSLAGLDDTDTKCGRENFNKMRAMIDTLVGVVRFDRDGYKKDDSISKIDKIEMFHKVNFARHLGSKYTTSYYMHSNV